MMITMELLLLGAISPVIAIGFVFVVSNSVGPLKSKDQLGSHSK